MSAEGLVLYDTRTRSKRVFAPLEPARVRVYSCGPTVYAPQHLGNMRSQLLADLLKRTLRFEGYAVEHVINITDVGHLTGDSDAGEDKLEQAAAQTGRRASEIAAQYTAQWLRDRERLGCLAPEVLCKATEHIAEQIALVQRLEAKGVSYRIADGIYFDTAKFPRYGEFAHLDLAGQASGARIADVAGKRQPADFALWKFAPPGVKRQQEWDSPWGRGFPGWHVECSAMADRYLGHPFDIHTGGVDHVAVHHTNEVAQSECAWDVHPWVGFWLHNEFLDLRGEKMAKSTGNVAVLDDLIARGLPPLAFRYLFLQAHYRQQQTFTDEAMDAAATGYDRLLAACRELREAAGEGEATGGDELRRRFRAAIRDDLNAPRALAVAWEATRAPGLAAAARWAVLREADAVLGLDLAHGLPVASRSESDPRIDGLVAERNAARERRDFATADRIRRELAAEGISIEDTPGGRSLEAHVSPRVSKPNKGQRSPRERRESVAPTPAGAPEPGAAPRDFKLVSEFEPKGDQPRAIEALLEGTRRGDPHQTLLGVTGSGKSFTIACVVEQLNRPTLVMAPNKTLAAQLYSELKDLFPENAVEYFVSYYDYYQPEAYLPATDTYIEKDSSVNDEIDKLRHSATHALLTRRDVLAVASVSAIYGLGAPETYGSMHAYVETGMALNRDRFLRRLVDMLYARNDIDFHRGTFRVRGDVVEVFPQYEAERALRIEFFGDEIESIAEIDPLRGKVISRPKRAMLYPASHYVGTEHTLRRAIEGIRGELQERLAALRGQGKLLECQRLEQRTLYDLEMLEQMGFCHGVENYSRWLDGRGPGDTPYTLFDYFPKDLLVVMDESHISVPQIGGMFRGDRARKEVLVEFGFRLPSALDNRPLRFEEWELRAPQRIYVSATPGPYELEKSGGVVVEQIIRPTGLTDPKVEVRPAGGQVDDLLAEIRLRVAARERVLVTTLTKRMAEELTDYYGELGIKVRYLHSDIKTLERMDILRELREGAFDVLVGINLLREGLDLPEVSLVAVLDADKEGFLRSTRSLIQTIGRAARNVNGAVILYADRETDSIRETLAETNRRREVQTSWNSEHGITPQTVKKRISSLRESIWERDYVTVPAAVDAKPPAIPWHELPELLDSLRREMREAAGELDFERAAQLRDRIRELEAEQLRLG